MASDKELTSGKAIKEQFAQYGRAGTPFDPVGGVDLSGANPERLWQVMRIFGWKDSRFVTQAEIDANNWKVAKDATSVRVKVRNRKDGREDELVMFNAENVLGMPSLAEMLAMPDEEIERMQGREIEGELQMMPTRELVHKAENELASAQELQPHEMTLAEFSRFAEVVKLENHGRQWEVFFRGERSGFCDAPTIEGALREAHAREVNNALYWNTPEAKLPSNMKRPAIPPANVLAEYPEVCARFADVLEKPLAPPEPSGRFAVHAPYWVNGLHNAKGIALAKEINKVIEDRGLSENRVAIEQLLSARPEAARFGLEVVDEEVHLSDLHWKKNVAEPRFLLDGAFVRDKEGAYRPVAGGRALVIDHGDSLSLKSRDKDGYAAAMELAIAKGWTAIELKGKPAMLAEAWLEAKLKGLDVVNYSPTKEDLEKYEARVAKEAGRQASAPGKVQEQSSEQVVVRPFVNANGDNKVATIRYTVLWEHKGQESAKFGFFDNAKDAAALFADIPPAFLPAVVRSVTRADRYVEAEVGNLIAGIQGPVGNTQKVAYADMDHEFAEAYQAVIEKNKNLENAAVASFSGAVIDVGQDENGSYVDQKIGRDPDNIMRHYLAKGAKTPVKGSVVDIIRVDGRSRVKERSLEVEGGGRELAR